MSEMKQVNVRVPKERKKRWGKHADEYGSMTRLIETAVENELSGSSSRTGEAEASASSEMVDDVARKMDSLENTVREMDKRLTAVRESVESSGPDYSFKAAVRETVPEEGGLYAGEIAARLDARESDVQEALDSLDGNEVAVHYVDKDQDEPMWTRLGGA
jgi:hypothetical protein